MSLREECLGKLPLTKEAVQSIYDVRNGKHPPAVIATWIKNLCLSHERLRAELEGAEILLREQASN